MAVAGLNLPDTNSNRKGMDCHDVRRSPGILGTSQTPRNAKRGDSPPRAILPWDDFLPTSRHDSGTNGRPEVQRQHNSKVSAFKELLDEGKKRLEKAGQEQQLRERAEVVGTIGGCELEDLLADLCEPSFSRRQNERLRRGIAARLRAKVARLFGTVMSQYSSMPANLPPGTYSSENGMARATATFRVKLNRLLDSSYLGEIQDQVTREISGTTRAPATRVRQRECRKHSNHHGSDSGGRPSSRFVKAPKPDVVGSTSARVSTAGAHGALIKPYPPSKRASTAIPIVAASARGRGRKSGVSKPSPPDRTLTAEAAVRRSQARGDAESSAGDEPHLGSMCSNPDAAEQQRKGNSSCSDAQQAAPSPISNESFDETAIFVRPSDIAASLHGSADGSCSEGSFDVYDGKSGSLGTSEWDSSSASSRGSSISDIEAPLPLRPASDEEPQDQRKEGTENNKRGETGDEEEQEERAEDRGGDVPVQSKPAKDGDGKASRRSRRKRRDEEKRTKRRPEERNTVLDGAWSNRWLTVLLTELGIHQSQQRTVLSEHMPAKIRVDGKAREGTPRAPSLSRIDRPHFSPAFVELPAAGRGCTLLMCPEPVAPAYEYSDVVEEVVKLHPPVGQLLLEEIEKGNIVTRSDALAHYQSLERGAVPNHAKLLVDEFLAADEVRNLIASAETLELDLALCTASGTLLNDDDIP